MVCTVYPVYTVRVGFESPHFKNNLDMSAASVKESAQLQIPTLRTSQGKQNEAFAGLGTWHLHWTPE